MKKIVSLILTIVSVVALAIPFLSVSAASASVPTTGWVWPVSANKTIYSPYTVSNVLSSKRSNHAGIDITKNADLEVVASRSGTVVKVVNSGTQGGTCCKVVLKHVENGVTFYSHYLHFKSGSVVVKNGQIVLAGQKLGITGKTGNATGVHLHFAVSTDEAGNRTVNVNPKSNSLVTSNNKGKYSNAEICTGGTFTYTTTPTSAEGTYGCPMACVNKTMTVSASSYMKTLPYSRSTYSFSNDVVWCTAGTKFYATETCINIVGNRWYYGYVTVNGKKYYGWNNVNNLK